MRAIVPSVGRTDGNVFVIIEGTGFLPGTNVLFGKVPAIDVVVVNEELITLISPPLPLGRVDVVLQLAEGEAIVVAEAFESIPTLCTDPADNDRDGRTNCEEKVGYVIRVDSVGFGTDPRFVKEFVVTSDPLVVDTDADGLTDLEEFSNKSNPRVSDSDGDGLGDFEEVNRWLTSPISIDSDGDARGPDGDLPPAAALFDGNELITVGFGTSGALFFSEYVHGSVAPGDEARSIALEIFNRTGEDIFLGDETGSDYAVVVHSFQFGRTELPLLGTLKNRGLFVIAEVGPSISLPVEPNQGGILFEGNEAITLEKNGIVIDAIGQISPIEDDQDSMAVPNTEMRLPRVVDGAPAWQSFTAGQDGYLTSVTVAFRSIESFELELTMTVHDGTGPGGAEIGISFLGRLPAFVQPDQPVTITPNEPIAVIQGGIYTFALTVFGGVDRDMRAWVLVDDTDPYPGGEANQATWDFQFVTGVSQAPPAEGWGEGDTSTVEHTLRRKFEICSADGEAFDAFDPADEWIGFPIDTFDGLGTHSALCPVNRIVSGGTSPTLADTDGDGKTDFEELDDSLRSPLIADIPSATLDIDGEIDVRLFTEFADSRGTESSFSSSFSESQSSSLSLYDSTSVSIGASFATTIGTESTAKLPPEAKLKTEFTAAVSMGLEKSWSTTRESSVSAQQAFSESRAESRTRQEVSSRGEISAGVVIENNGNLTYTLTNLAITVRQFIPDLVNRTPLNPRAGTFRTVGTLLPEIGSFTLAPGDRSPVIQVSDENINPVIIKEFLANPTSLTFEAAGFELEDAEGFNFKFLNDTTRGRTASILIDFGDADIPAERYRVATNVIRNMDSSLAGIPLRTVLEEMIGLPRVSCAPTESELRADPDFERGYVVEHSRDPGDAPCEGSGPKVLTHVRGLGFETVPGSFWIIAIASDASSVEIGSIIPGDFDDIRLFPGDTLSIILTRNDDGDGLTLAEEINYGTSDATADTDGDGIEDVDELNGWTVVLSDGTERNVVSDPRTPDSDLDGLTDLEEFLGRDGVPPDPEAPLTNDATDPMEPDTDGDVLVDSTDPFPLNRAVRLYVNPNVPVLGIGGADLCDDAQVISGPGRFLFDTSAGGTEVGPQDVCDDIEKDVWFRWRNTTRGELVRFSLCEGTALDTRIEVAWAASNFPLCPPGPRCKLSGRTCAQGVFTTNPLSCGAGEGLCQLTSSVNLVTCNADFCGTQSETFFVFPGPLELGTEFLIRVGSAPGSPGGTGVLKITVEDNQRPWVTDEGTTWDLPFPNLQQALRNAFLRNFVGNPQPTDAVSEIWVAAGVYRPDEDIPPEGVIDGRCKATGVSCNPNDPLVACGVESGPGEANECVPDTAGGGGIPTEDRSRSFALIENVEIYGGFAGTESELAQRNPDPLTNGTILTGDLLGNDSGLLDDLLNGDPTRNDNSIIVVKAEVVLRPAGATAVLDGFTIRDANGSGLLSERGGPTLRNLLFTFNRTVSAGSALSHGQVGGGGGTTLTMSNCTFSKNLGPGEGTVSLRAEASLTDCVFKDNQALLGGAIITFNPGPKVLLDRCTFERNTAGGGGALWLFAGDIIIKNCVFRNNDSNSISLLLGHGGAIAAVASTVTITNSEFWRNVSEGGGSAIVVNDDAEVVLNNCTLNQNMARTPAGIVITDRGGAIFATSGKLQILNSILWGNTTDANLFGFGACCDMRSNPAEPGICLSEGQPEGNCGSLVFYPGLTCDQTVDCFAAPRSNLIPTEFAQVFSSGVLLDIHDSCIEGLNVYRGFGNIGFDPLLVNEALGDLQLSEGSPCIDTGGLILDIDPFQNGIQPLPDFDLLLNPRILDGDSDGRAEIDMGAFEFNGSPD